MRQCRDAGQVNADGVDVRQVHLHGVTRFFTELEGSARCRWAGDHVTLFESRVEIVGDQTANPLCLQIVGIVVAVRQHIGADEDAAFDFFTKTLRTRFGVHVVEVGVVRCAIAVTHAVKTRQVGTGFGRGDHVISGYRLANRRQQDLNGFGAEFAVFSQRGFDSGHGGGVAVSAEEFFR